MDVDVQNKAYKEYCNLIYRLGMGYRPDYQFLLEEISLLELGTELDNYSNLLEFYLSNKGELSEGSLPEYISEETSYDVLLDLWKINIELKNKVDRKELPEIQNPYNHPYTNVEQIDNVGEALDTLLNKDLEIESAIVSPNIAEIGETIPTVKFSWKYNKDIASQRFGELQLSNTVREYTLSNVNSTTTKVLSASDGSTTVNTTMSIIFKKAAYYGSAPGMQLNSNFIISNFKRDLQFKKGSTVTINGEDYIYFVVPKELEDIVFSVGGFEGGFELVDNNFKFTKNGVTSNYVIFRSDISGLGETTITIK